MTKKKEWAGTTYGNNWMHKYLIRILNKVDIRVIYTFVALFIIPVCILVNPGRKHIYAYFRTKLGYSPFRSFVKTCKNFYLFGQVVVDRFAMYAGRTFDVEIEGANHFHELSACDDGFLQLSAHIGNYEIAGYSLKAERKRFNALVYAGEKGSVMENRNRMFHDTNIRMIEVSGDMGHLFEINSALANGEIVSMPADRMLGSVKSMQYEFMGHTASFPAGPFAIATSRSLNVIMVNVMKTSWNKYRIYVVPLLYDKLASRKEQMSQLLASYVRELETILKIYPEQWYNYYNFWK